MTSMPPIDAWLALGVFGMVLGFWIGPMALLRIAIGLVMLAGLGLLLSNTAGYEHLSYWFAAGMTAVAAAFAAVIAGAAIGRGLRVAVSREPVGRLRHHQDNSVV